MKTKTMRYTMRQPVSLIFLMALIKYGNGVAQKSGKEGGTVYSHNTYGTYSRQWRKPTDPQTVAQMNVRADFASLSAAWQGLTGNQRQGWISLASVTAFTNRLGDRIFLTGQALYNKVNRNLQSAGGATLDDQNGWVEPSAPLTITPTASAGGLTFSLAWTPTPVPAGLVYQVYATDQQSPGVKFNKRKLFIRNLAAATASPQDIHTRYTALFGALVEGKKIQVWMRTVDTTNGAASPFIKEIITVAA